MTVVTAVLPLQMLLSPNAGHRWESYTINVPMGHFNLH